MLTGGTKDVNPQYMLVYGDIPVATPSANVFFPLPVPKFPGNNNRAVVMEILEIDYMLTGVGYPTPAVVGAIATMQSIGYIATSDLSGLTFLEILNNPKLISAITRQTNAFVDAAMPTGTTFETLNLKEEDDLTDEAGHGFLVATDGIYVGGVGRAITNTTDTQSFAQFAARILYRMKEIGLAEYIGIVQGQQ